MTTILSTISSSMMDFNVAQLASSTSIITESLHNRCHVARPLDWGEFARSYAENRAIMRC